MSRPMTLTEKIMAHSAGLTEVSPGQMITAKIGLAYTMDMLGKLVFDHLKSAGATKVFDPEKVVVAFDHCAPAPDVHYANLHNEVRRLAKEYKIRVFDIGRHGIMHHVVAEEGYLVPGIIAVATDSHALTGGALGAVVLGMGATDAAMAMATGELWLRVPATVKVEIEGSLPKGTMSRDIMLYMMGQKGWDGTKAEWAYQAIELTGETVKKMSMDSRFALCNLSSDAGAKNAIIPPDHVTQDYLKGRTKRTFQTFQSDPQAEYVDTIKLEVSKFEPQVACPHSPDNVKPLSQVLGTKIHVATVASCSGGRLEDLHAAARILEGRKVHPDVRMIVSPVSQKVYQEAMEDGTFSTFIKAGALVAHATCGPCIGIQLVLLGDGEVCIGSVPRNMQGRMGSPKSEIYSANPAVVAASAIKGAIADPREFL
jgi:3-isopropylmalate/(R)-2-methylmalate dehydratase large subunit